MNREQIKAAHTGLRRYEEMEGARALCREHVEVTWRGEGVTHTVRLDERSANCLRSALVIMLGLEADRLSALGVDVGPLKGM